MTEEMKQKRDELAKEKYPLEYYELAGGYDGFITGFDAAYKLMEAENAELKKEVNRLHEKYDFQLLVKREEILKSRIEKLEYALEYYADTEHYEKYVNVSLPPSVKNRITSDIEGERGARARAALKADEGEG